MHISLPTIRWKGYLKEETDEESLAYLQKKYKPALLSETEEVLTDFLHRMQKINGKKSPQLLEKEVENLVITLNQISSKNDYFIATGEREDLCEFIDEVILSTGYPLEEDQDLTLNYREW